MTARGVVEHALLWSGVACELVCVLGLLLMRRPLDRLHFAMASTSVGLVLIVAAVLVHEAFDQVGINAVVVGIVLLFLSPVVAHATARVAHIRAPSGACPRSGPGEGVRGNRVEVPPTTDEASE